jgi:hypothetical protein
MGQKKHLQNIKNTLQPAHKITQLDLVGNSTLGIRSYTSASSITEAAIGKFRRTGNGLTYVDLMDNGMVIHKKQAQETLKYHLRRSNLFSLVDRRPQQYYPTKFRSEIIEKLAKNTPINPSGVGHLILPINPSNDALSQCLQYITIHTLEDYVLPLLPEAPLFIHNLHFKTKVPSDFCELVKLPQYVRNNGKHYQEIVGKTLVNYVIYKDGIVDITTRCSNNPYKLETEEDRFRIIQFFGQLRAGLINLVYDKHERMIPDVLEWELTECDINKDIKISDLLHFSAIKIQVKHVDHFFRIYIKALGKDTVCRVEENKQPKKPAIEVINEVFNPTEKLEKILLEYTNKTEEVLKYITGLLKPDLNI